MKIKIKIRKTSSHHQTETAWVLTGNARGRIRRSLRKNRMKKEHCKEVHRTVSVKIAVTYKPPELKVHSV